MKLLTENDINYFDSSNILFSYYNNTTFSLHICFVNGQSYKYNNVLPNINQSFNDAKSQGKYFVEVIKPKYSFVKDKKYSKFEIDSIMSAVKKM